MARSRALVFGLLAFALLAADANLARADLAPWPFRTKRPFPPPAPAPDPAPNANDPITPGLDPNDQKRMVADEAAILNPRTGEWEPIGKQKRTGLFRTCGSGMGVSLAGVGLAWGMLWLGTRLVGRVRGAKPDRTN